MFTNLGNGKFSDVAHPLRCDELEESRGVAVVDLNKDGQLDLVINNNDAAPTIYLNRISGPGAYFRCNLTGAGVSESATMASSLDAIGARVEVDIQIADEKRTLVRQVEAGSGYAAQSEPSLHF